MKFATCLILVLLSTMAIMSISQTEVAARPEGEDADAKTTSTTVGTTTTTTTTAAPAEEPKKEE